MVTIVIVLFFTAQSGSVMNATNVQLLLNYIGSFHDKQVKVESK